jgi:hypothetical protein
MESIGWVSLKLLIGFVSFVDKLLCDSVGVPVYAPAHPGTIGVVAELEPLLFEPDAEDFGVQDEPRIDIVIHCNHIG